MQVKERHFFSHYPLTKTNKNHLELLAKNVNPKVPLQEKKHENRVREDY